MNLHLGCGRRKLPGWTGVDSRPEVEPDVVADVRDLSFWAAGEVDAIYACHVLEHIPRPELLPTLREWRRVLKTGGILRVSVPDFDAIARLRTKERMPMQRLIGLLHGRQDEPWNTHYLSYDWDLLAHYLTEVGFYQLRRWEPEKVHPAGYDDYSFAELDGWPVSLNMEATRGG
jgi:predicted SAM-dependent methyltransferase